MTGRSPLSASAEQQAGLTVLAGSRDRGEADRARAVLPRLAVTQTRLGCWLRGLLERAHKNTVVVALANKLARIAWAVLAGGRNYEAAAAAA